ncbi:putative carbohydrate-binding protein [Phytophthora cinnamomi]|uniref:putative carbohydrate-binding protein n=1 Tax=Phytophthora cinnamomi TaxID=4785 RepID=UPI003559D701|nr:putative carbohydrate-binding protein [Phytophthora cinnamomi]
MGLLPRDAVARFQTELLTHKPTTDYAALNDKQWDGLQNCGRCAEVSCADKRCADQSKSIVVQILDRCPECAYVTWILEFVDCPVSGNANYCLKGGSNNYWTVVQPTNFATGVKSLQINGQDTTMLGSAYYYLLDGASQTQTDLTSMTISMTDVNGNSIEDTVLLTADSGTEGSNQFPSGGSSQTAQQSSPTCNNPTPTTAATTKAPTTAPPTQAPTPSPTPTLTQTPVSTTRTPSPTTNSETARGSGAAQQHFNIAGTVEPEATTAPKEVVKTSKPVATTPLLLLTMTAHQQTQQSAGVPAATTAAPSSEQQTADSQASGDEAQKANTKSGETSASTDPLIIVLSTVGAVGLVTLIVAVVIAKRKDRRLATSKRRL